MVLKAINLNKETWQREVLDAFLRKANILSCKNDTYTRTNVQYANICVVAFTHYIRSIHLHCNLLNIVIKEQSQLDRKINIKLCMTFQAAKKIEVDLTFLQTFIFSFQICKFFELKCTFVLGRPLSLIRGRFLLHFKQKYKTNAIFYRQTIKTSIKV
jgi:hypothetical protein